MGGTRREFPESFKREAVHRVASSGRSAGAVARELGLHEAVLRRWMTQFGAQQVASDVTLDLDTTARASHAHPPEWAADVLLQIKAILRDGEEGLDLKQIAFFEDLLDKMRIVGNEPEAVVRSVFSHVASRWGCAVMVALLSGKLRFGALRRLLGVTGERPVSQRIMTLTLRTLERDGLVLRTVHDGSTLRVDYQLSPLGRQLAEMMMTMIEWLVHNNEHIQAARERFDEFDLR
jgi:DNA-binding HxlR family transcriptional regulator/transposase-like protein